MKPIELHCGDRSQRRPVRLPRTFEEIVDEIVMFTDLPIAEVQYRVWMQALARLECTPGCRSL